MSLQWSTVIRNSWLDQIEVLVGTSPVIKIRTGAPPANCAAADTGVVLATIALPADWMAAAASGSKGKLGTWADPEADATGIAGHFRLVDSEGVCHLQGSISETGGGGDMTVNASPMVAGLLTTVTNWTLTAGGA